MKHFNRNQRVYAITLLLLLLFQPIIELASSAPVLAYPNNQQEFEEYLDSIGYPIEVNVSNNIYRAKYQTYDIYGQIIYGNP